MSSTYLSNLQTKFQRRINRLKNVDVCYFYFTLCQFWRFFIKQPTLYGIADLLLHEFPGVEGKVEKILNTTENITGETEEEAAAIATTFFATLASKERGFTQDAISNIGLNYRDVKNDAVALEVVREVFLEPFYEYVDEQLDDQRAILALLLRYKHRSEWFFIDHLWELSQTEGKAEHELALNLYSYLYDQGLEFHIEPSSNQGEIDLIAAQGTEDPLLLDAKVFDGDGRGKSYLRKAFNQIYTYTKDYNEPFGYLVIFKITDRDLHFALPMSQYSNIPVVVYNHKTIFLITVDIYQYKEPVSQRSPLQAIEITQEDLIKTITESRTEDDV